MRIASIHDRRPHLRPGGRGRREDRRDRRRPALHPDRVDRPDVCRGRRAAPRAGDSSEQGHRDRQELPRPRQGDGWGGTGRAADVPHPQHGRRRAGRPGCHALAVEQCPLRGRTGRRHRSDVQGRRTRGCAEGRLRLHLRQRRHRPGPAEVRRAVVARQGLRHLLPTRAVDRDRPRPDGPTLVTRLDGEIVQDGHTSDMVHGVAELISHASKAFTLLPGTSSSPGRRQGSGRSRSASGSTSRSATSAS